MHRLLLLGHKDLLVLVVVHSTSAAVRCNFAKLYRLLAIVDLREHHFATRTTLVILGVLLTLLVLPRGRGCQNRTTFLNLLSHLMLLMLNLLWMLGHILIRFD